MVNLAKLSVFAYTQGFTSWFYRPADIDDGVNASLEPGYFNAGADLVSTGDIIFIGKGTDVVLRVIEKTDAGIVTLIPLR